MISLVIPSYNEQDNIVRTYETIQGILNQAKIDFEIIFVDDGSVDNTYVNGFPFPATSARKRPFSPVSKLLPENVQSLWTVICSILPHFFLKCTNYGRMGMR